jgi:hypothetical protein
MLLNVYIQNSENSIGVIFVFKKLKKKTEDVAKKPLTLEKKLEKKD